MDTASDLAGKTMDFLYTMYLTGEKIHKCILYILNFPFNCFLKAFHSVCKGWKDDYFLAAGGSVECFVEMD